MMNTTLGKRIATRRREKGMKQDELAERLGVSPQAVSKWENDQTCPDISLLPSLAKILGVSIDELLSGKREEIASVRMLPEHERKSIEDMMLRIVILGPDGDVARVNLPLAVIEVLLESGLPASPLADNQAFRSIDLGRVLDMVKKGAIGNIVEVESADGGLVQIFVE